VHRGVGGLGSFRRSYGILCGLCSLLALDGEGGLGRIGAAALRVPLGLETTVLALQFPHAGNQLRGQLVAALAPFPEARVAVAAVLAC
jgi:hypothetical protein